MKKQATPEQIEKLPNWAKEEIKRLNTLLNRATEEKENLSQILKKENPDTNTFLVDGLDKIPLPKDSKIRFRTKLGEVDIKIKEDNVVNVNAYFNGFIDAAIVPISSNCFDVKFFKF